MNGPQFFRCPSKGLGTGGHGPWVSSRASGARVADGTHVVLMENGSSPVPLLSMIRESSSLGGMSILSCSGKVLGAGLCVGVEYPARVGSSVGSVVTGGASDAFSFFPNGNFDPPGNLLM